MNCLCSLLGAVLGRTAIKVPVRSFCSLLLEQEGRWLGQGGVRAQEPNLDLPVVRAKGVHTDEPLPPRTQLAKCWDFSSLPKGLTHANGCLHGHEKLLPTKNKLTDIAGWHYRQLLPVFPEQSH